MFNVVVLGDEEVGKSALVDQFVFGAFVNSATPHRTVGVRKETKQELVLWDTGGQEQYHELFPIYLQTAHAVLIVVDVSRADWRERTNYWKNLINDVVEMSEWDAPLELRDNWRAKLVVMVVGNKSDLVNSHDSAESAAAAETVQSITAIGATPNAHEANELYVTASAKNKASVKAMFDGLTHKLKQTYPSDEVELAKLEINKNIKLTDPSLTLQQLADQIEAKPSFVRAFARAVSGGVLAVIKMIGSFLRSAWEGVTQRKAAGTPESKSTVWSASNKMYQTTKTTLEGTKAAHAEIKTVNKQQVNDGSAQSDASQSTAQVSPPRQPKPPTQKT